MFRDPSGDDCVALAVDGVCNLNDLGRHVLTRSGCVALDPPHGGLGVGKDQVVRPGLMVRCQAVEFSHNHEQLGVVGLLMCAHIKPMPLYSG